jgi:hypothetical protein
VQSLSKPTSAWGTSIRVACRDIRGKRGAGSPTRFTSSVCL